MFRGITRGRGRWRFSEQDVDNVNIMVESWVENFSADLDNEDMFRYSVAQNDYMYIYTSFNISWGSRFLVQ